MMICFYQSNTVSGLVFGTFKTDHWRCRFTNPNGEILNNSDVLELLKSVQEEGFDFIKTEHLYHFDGKRGYSLSQGE